jgi:Mg2+-importing ATPase
LVGYIAFLDPPKESAGRALAAFAKHGVQVQVLTGDNEIVTRKIWREVGLPVERVVLGSEIESLTPVQLAELAEQAQVFAKLSPGKSTSLLGWPARIGHRLPPRSCWLCTGWTPLPRIG